MSKRVLPALTISLVQTLALAATPHTFETQPQWVRPGNIYGSFGYVVVGAGDTDADGFDDVLVTGPLYAQGSPSANQQGAVLLYRGSPTGLPASNSWSEIGALQGATMGKWAAPAGDVNGDGYDDIIFESDGWDTTSRIHVRYGPGMGPTGTWNYDTNQFVTFHGPPVDGGGDLNGDGYDDIVAGFPKSDGDKGCLRVFNGSAAGLSTQPSRSLLGVAGERFAGDVEFAGDVNGDGFDDVLTCSDPTSGPRLLKLFRGTSTGMETTPAWTFQSADVWCPGFKMLTAGGDLNGDGYDDVVVGLPRKVHEAGEGMFLVFFGSSGGLATQPSQVVYGDGQLGNSAAGVDDVNRDGFDDLVVGAPLMGGNGKALLLLGSEIGVQPVPAWVNEDPPDAVAIGHSVASAGDVNADGYVDLIVGDPYFFGRANLFLGVPLAGPGPAGSVGLPENEPLTLGRDADGRPVLNWGSACGGGADYAIYTGSIGDFSSRSPVTCSTGGLRTWTLPSDESSRYFLIVPRSQDREGSYGRDGSGVERAVSLNPCLTQETASCN